MRRSWTSDGTQVDQLCDDWLVLVRQCGLVVEDLDGELQPDVVDAISHTVVAAIWFGLTTGYLTLAEVHHPRKFLTACHAG